MPSPQSFLADLPPTARLPTIFVGHGEERNFSGVAEAGAGGRLARLSHPTPERFLPALYSLGVADEKDALSFFNASFDMASLSKRSFVLS